MKKILVSLLLLGACATTNVENGLNRLENEPKNCKFLYTMDSTATSYKLSGALDYVEKSILEQDKQGDSYYIVKQDIFENPDAIFGPKSTYKFKVKVYNCKK